MVPGGHAADLQSGARRPTVPARQATEPEDVSVMYALFVISMWFHLLAAVVWIGGLLFISMVLVPTLREPSLRAQAMLLLRTTGQKFKRIAYASLVLLVVTGVANVYFRVGGSLEVLGGFMGVWWGQMLIAKIVLTFVVIGFALYHDFAVGPAATRAVEADPDAPETQALRRRASWIGRINLLLSLVIMTLALLLVRGLPG
jgi:copper resistance protein D